MIEHGQFTAIGQDHQSSGKIGNFQKLNLGFESFLYCRLPCDPWCPDCGGDGGGEITVPTTVQTTAQPPVTEPTTITTTGPGPTNPPCNCPCIPW